MFDDYHHYTTKNCKVNGSIWNFHFQKSCNITNHVYRLLADGWDVTCCFSSALSFITTFYMSAENVLFINKELYNYPINMDTYVTLNFIALDNKMLSFNAKSSLFCDLMQCHS